MFNLLRSWGVTHTISPSQKDPFDVEGVDPEKIVPNSSKRFVSQPSMVFMTNTPIHLETHPEP